ncbi:TPA: bacteriocin immunity protein [Citrobacter koseri]|nr:hypothetical protein MC77_003665 [Citrobacter koseri]HAT7564227.1 bacteriocin immunity protein [Citrobacter koseri]
MIYISRDIRMFKNCLKDYTESEILAFLNEFFENSKDLKGNEANEMETNYIIFEEVYHIENVKNIYDELSTIDFTKTVSEEAIRLDEDLFQLTQNNGVAIDIGWYPSLDEKGEFLIQVISDGDWDHPMIKTSSGWDKNELIEKLNIVLEQLPFCLKS